jgi:hypothetical protein
MPTRPMTPAKSNKECRANIARRLSRSTIPKASAPRLHQKNRLRPKSKTPCPISQPSAHAQRVSPCRFLRSQPRRIGLGYHRTGRDPDTPSFTIARLTSRLSIQTGKAFRTPQAGGDPLWKSEMRPKRDKTRGCCGSTKSGIVALGRSWREIFLRRPGTGTKKKKTGKNERTGFTSGELRDETMTNPENETMLNMNRAPP